MHFLRKGLDMARREITQFYDDLDGSPLSESEHQAVHFSFNGTEYVLDLSKDNVAKFHEALMPFIAAAREVPTDPRSKVDASQIRAWARKKGMKVAQRGKIPFEVIDAYRRANA